MPSSAFEKEHGFNASFQTVVADPQLFDGLGARSLLAGPASSSWVQQASRRKTALGRPRAGRRGTLTQNVPLGSRVVSQKVNFLGQGNKGRLISSAVRKRWSGRRDSNPRRPAWEAIRMLNLNHLCVSVANS